MAKRGTVYCMFGNKGGTGKSIISAHLGVYLEAKGRDFAVIDLDSDQLDSEAFFGGREDPVDIYAVRKPKGAGALELLRTWLSTIPASGKDVVVDCAPAFSDVSQMACDMADVLVMPFKPGANDARALGRALRIASSDTNPKKIVSVLNFVNQTRDAKSLLSLLSTTDFFMFAGNIGHRTAFNEALRKKKAIWEIPGLDDLASKEIAWVSDFIYQQGGGRE